MTCQERKYGFCIPNAWGHRLEIAVKRLVLLRVVIQFRSERAISAGSFWTDLAGFVETSYL